MTDQWLGLASGLLLAGVVLALAFYGMRGGRLLCSQVRRFVCPISGKVVDCAIVRDVRTGQFKQVESCTAFPDPGDVRCQEDCTTMMNLGLPLQGEQERP